MREVLPNQPGDERSFTNTLFSKKHEFKLSENKVFNSKREKNISLFF